MTRLQNSTPLSVSMRAALVLALLVIASCTRTEPVEKKVPAEPSPSAAQMQPTDAELESVLAQAKQLYTNHCAACHGDAGDGKGDAAKWLYPRPRDFRRSEFRIVTTDNGNPSDADLLGVLDRGMPGSAMPSFAHLSGADKTSLVAYVRHLTSQGIEQQQIADAKEFGDEPDLEEIAEVVADRIRPGDRLAIPELKSATSESIERGAKVYAEACVSCHGKTGKGDGAEQQFNTDGTPTRPRDFTKGIFKGRPEPEELFARVRAGMPGSPMPAEKNLTDEQVSDLAAFVLSMSDEETRRKAVLQRLTITAQQVDETLTNDPDSPLWSATQPVRLTMTPLWWRDYDDLSIQVQALHDGKSLAVRLSWNDVSQNIQAVRPQEFEDMVALQLFRGSPEPFLGMGTDAGSVDVWLWQPSRQTAIAQRPDVDTAYPNMVVDMYPFEQAGDGPRPHATGRQSQTFITAWAVENPRSDPTANGSASLEASGFGTLTARPHVSQLVSAGASWRDGRWAVVLRRPLGVDAESGISLEAGDRLSIAFAVWDGAARDRNGQKRITVWQDLELE